MFFQKYLFYECLKENVDFIYNIIYISFDIRLRFYLSV